MQERAKLHQELVLSVAENRQATHSTGVEASVSATLQRILENYPQFKGEAARALQMLKDKKLIPVADEKDLLEYMEKYLSKEEPYKLIPSGNMISLVDILDLVCAASLETSQRIYPSETPEEDQAHRALTFYITLRHIYLGNRCPLGKGNTIVMCLNRVYPNVTIIEQIPAFLLATGSDFYQKKLEELRAQGKHDVLYNEILKRMSSEEIGKELEGVDAEELKSYWTEKLRGFNVDPLADDYVLKEMDKIVAAPHQISIPHLKGEERTTHALECLSLYASNYAAHLAVPEFNLNFPSEWGKNIQMAWEMAQACKTFAEMRDSGLVEFVEYIDLYKNFEDLLKEIGKVPPLKELADPVRKYMDSIKAKLGAWDFLQKSLMHERGLVLSSKKFSAKRAEFRRLAETIAYEDIRDFFALWMAVFFYRVDSEKWQEHTRLYNKVMSLNESTRTVNDSEIPDMRAGVEKYIEEDNSEKAQVKEEGTSNLSLYVFNRIFLHAVTHAPRTWSNDFLKLFQDALRAIKKLSESKNHLELNLKGSSYPQSFVDHLEFLLELREEKEIQALPLSWCYFPIKIADRVSREVIAQYVDTHIREAYLVSLSLSPQEWEEVYSLTKIETKIKLLPLFPEAKRFSIILNCLGMACRKRHIEIIVYAIPVDERFAFVQKYWGRISQFFEIQEFHWVFLLIPHGNYLDLMRAHPELGRDDVLLKAVRSLLETRNYEDTQAAVKKLGGREKITAAIKSGLEEQEKDRQGLPVDRDNLNQYRWRLLWMILPPEEWQRARSEIGYRFSSLLVKLVLPERKLEMAKSVIASSWWDELIILQVLPLFTDDSDRLCLLDQRRRGFDKEETFGRVCALIPTKTPLDIARTFRKEVFVSRGNEFINILKHLPLIKDKALLIMDSQFDSDEVMLCILRWLREAKIITHSEDVAEFTRHLDGDKRTNTLCYFADFAEDRAALLDIASEQRHIENVVSSMPEDQRFDFVCQHWDRIHKFSEAPDVYWVFSLIPTSHYAALMDARPELSKDDPLLTLVRAVIETGNYKKLSGLGKVKESIGQGSIARARRSRWLEVKSTKPFLPTLPLLWMILPPQEWDDVLRKIEGNNVRDTILPIHLVLPSKKLDMAKAIIRQSSGDQYLLDVLRLFPSEEERLSILSEKGRYFDDDKTLAKICALIPTKTPLEVALALNNYVFYFNGLRPILKNLPSIADKAVLINNTKLDDEMTEKAFIWLRKSKTIQNGDDVAEFLGPLAMSKRRGAALYFADLVEPDKVDKVAACLPPKEGLAKLVKFWKSPSVADEIREAKAEILRRAPKYK